MDDIFGMQMTSIKLSGARNYLQWAKAVEVFLKAKGKHNYLTDNLLSSNDKMKVWQKEN